MPTASKPVHPLILPVLGLILLLCSGTSFSATATQTSLALEKAKAFLYSRQKNGNWEDVASPSADFKDINGGQWSGMTAIATYALLCAGEKPTDPRLASAIDFLTKTETRGIYAAGTRCLVWGSLEQTPKLRAAAKKDAALLLAAMRTQGAATGLYYYTPPSSPHDAAYDHSVSQFAALGLWTLSKQGYEVPMDFWTSTDRAWRAHQYPEGGWSYVFDDPGDWGKQTASMTAAGVATLFITDEFLHPLVECKGGIPDANINRGIEWLANNFDAVTDSQKQLLGWHYEQYSLYGVSRIGVASGLKYFGQVDWYQRGVDFLTRTQQADGAWAGAKPAVAETALGMLFLEYGGAPVILEKLQYSLDRPNSKNPIAAHWDQRPQDALNFVTWMGKQLEVRLNWEIINLSATPESMHDGPILFIAGDQILGFSQEELKKLRMFVEDGGLILGNCDCGNPAFSTGFEKLGASLFPNYKFRQLPASHPIFTDEQYPASKWRARPRVKGLSNGVRELMLLPDVDLSRAFQGRNDRTHPEFYQLADDIALYSVDKSGLRTKGDSYLVTADPKVETNRTIKLARLQYAGNWDPEPGGWRRLAAILHNQNKLDLVIEPVRPGEGKLQQYSLAHMTGTEAFELSESQRLELQKFVQGGGTLIVDAAGGSPAFASKAEELVASLQSHPSAKAPSLLPPDAPLYRTADANIDTVGYRTFARSRSVGALKTPRICGVEEGGRVICYCSREDLSAGLVGQQIDGIDGYTPQSATAIMRNIILSSLPKPK